MIQAAALIVFGALSRLLPHLTNYDAWNLVPIGAIALYAGARLPKQIAWSVPVFAMLFSDLVMDQWFGFYFDSPTRWISYATLAGIALLGLFAQGTNVKVLRLAGLSLSGSFLFFLTSNFGCWAWPEGVTYPHTLAGLTQCYAAALPFLKNSVLADLVGTFALFLLAPVIAQVWNRVTTGSLPESKPADLV